MPLDTNVALGVKTPEFANPLALYSQALGLQHGANQNALAQYTLAKAQREDADQNMLRQALQGVDINTPEGQAKARNALLSVGKVKDASDFDKNLLERRNMQSQISERDAKRAREGLEILSGAVAPLVNKPNLTHDDILAAGGRLEQMGILDPSWKQGVPMNAAELPAYVSNLAMTIDNGRKALELRAPKTEIKDVGNALQQFNTDKLTGATTVGPVLAPKTPEGFNRAAGGGMVIDPGFLAGKSAIANAGASKTVTHINSFLPASEEAQRDFIKSTRTTYDQLKQAPVALESIEKAKALIPSAKGFMGPGGESLLDAAKFLNNRIGTNINTEGVKNAEELRTRIFFNIMDNLKKMDAQPSQQQQVIMQEALGKLGTDPNALPAVLDAFGDVIKGKVQLHNNEVNSAIQRGVKFPYDPIVNLDKSSEKPKPSATSLTPAEQSELEALRKRFKK